jgi:molybdopterin-containing oxidoreductase family membrane subunit
LLWDVFAITTYFIVSSIFFYLGLLPDINLLKNKLNNRVLNQFYHKISLKSLTTKSQWKTYKKLMLFLAGIATPLVLSVHSIVSMDFATSLVPGWHSTIFPPFFVAGAIFSGFAAVQVLVIITRKTLELEHYITLQHIDKMNKIILLTGCVVTLAYGIELFIDLQSGKETLKYLISRKMYGVHALLWWGMIICNVVLPQLFWSVKIRRNSIITFIISIFILVGMWIERYLIVVPSLETSYIPARWDQYSPSITEIGLFTGTIGMFLVMYLLFIRWFPVVSIFENLQKNNSDEQKFK